MSVSAREKRVQPTTKSATPVCCVTPLPQADVFAELVTEMKAAGFAPRASGRDDGSGCGWAEFESEQDLLRFLGAVVRYESGSESIYQRVCRPFGADDAALA